MVVVMLHQYDSRALISEVYTIRLIYALRRLLYAVFSNPHRRTTLSERCHYYFCDNLDKFGQILKILSLLDSKMNYGGSSN